MTGHGPARRAQQRAAEEALLVISPGGQTTPRRPGSVLRSARCSDPLAP